MIAAVADEVVIVVVLGLVVGVALRRPDDMG